MHRLRRVCPGLSGDGYFCARRSAGKVEQFHADQRRLVCKTGEVARSSGKQPAFSFWAARSGVPLFRVPAPKIRAQHLSIDLGPSSYPLSSAPATIPTLLGEESSTILNVACGGFA